MCVLGVLLRMNDQYPFIMIDNRDEFLHRATQPSISLDQSSGIVCARDLVHGGTWCGCNTRSGAIAVLTNVYEPELEALVGGEKKRSRGEIIDFLLRRQQQQQNVTLSEHEKNNNSDHRVSENHARRDDHVDLSQLLRDRRLVDEYNGYNVIVGNVFDLCLTSDAPLYSMSNRKRRRNAPKESNLHHHYAPDEPAEIESFTRGCLSVANSFMNDDSWAKVRYLRNEMYRTLQRISSSSSMQDTGEQQQQHQQQEEELTVERLRDELSQLLLVRSLEQYSPREQQEVADVNPLGGESGKYDAFVHENMNNIFVQYSFEGRMYKTRSQTVVIGERNGTVHYFYRTTDQHDLTDKCASSPPVVTVPWDHITFSPPPPLSLRTTE